MIASSNIIFIIIIIVYQNTTIMAKTATTIAIILAAATDTKLEQEIQRSDDPEIYKLRGLPKALCPVGDGKTSILEHWYNILQRNRDLRQIFIVSSAAKYQRGDGFTPWFPGNTPMVSFYYNIECVILDFLTGDPGAE